MNPFKIMPVVTLLFLGGSFFNVSQAGCFKNGSKACYAKTITLDPYLLPYLHSNRALNNVMIEYTDFTATAFDFVSDKLYVGSIFPLRFLFAVAWGYFPNFNHYVYGPSRLTIHEYGHGSRGAAAGAAPSFGYFDSGAVYGHWLPYFLHRFLLPNSGGFATAGGTIFNPSYNPSYWSSVGSMGGMNNSMTFTETYGDRIYYRDGHIVGFYNYLYSKLDAYYYVRSTIEGGLPSGQPGDVANVLSYYSSQGFGVTYDDLSIGSALSLLASGTTYSFLWGIGRYVAIDDPVVRSFEIGKLRVPDLQFYMTSNGPSYKLTSAWRKSQNQVIPFALEVVYKGRMGAELSIGHRTMSGQSEQNPGSFFEIGGQVSSYGTIGAHVIKQGKFSSNMIYQLGATLYHARGLHDERNVNAILLGQFGIEAFANLAWVY